MPRPLDMLPPLAFKLHFQVFQSLANGMKGMHLSCYDLEIDHDPDCAMHIAEDTTYDIFCQTLQRLLEEAEACTHLFEPTNVSGGIDRWRHAGLSSPVNLGTTAALLKFYTQAVADKKLAKMAIITVKVPLPQHLKDEVEAQKKAKEKQRNPAMEVDDEFATRFMTLIRQANTTCLLHRGLNNKCWVHDGLHFPLNGGDLHLWAGERLEEEKRWRSEHPDAEDEPEWDITPTRPPLHPNWEPDKGLQPKSRTCTHSYDITLTSSESDGRPRHCHRPNPAAAPPPPPPQFLPAPTVNLSLFFLAGGTYAHNEGPAGMNGVAAGAGAAPDNTLQGQLRPLVTGLLGVGGGSGADGGATKGPGAGAEAVRASSPLRQGVLATFLQWLDEGKSVDAWPGEKDKWLLAIEELAVDFEDIPNAAVASAAEWKAAGVPAGSWKQLRNACKAFKAEYAAGM